MVAGAAVISTRRWTVWGDFALLVRGPVWSSTLPDQERRAALAALLSTLRERHRGVMAAPDRIGGADPLAERPWLEVVTPISMARIPLEAPVEELRAKQGQKWRNRLTAAERSGLSVESVPWRPGEEPWLLKLDAAQSRQKGYRVDHDYTLAWARGGDQATRLFTARRHGATVAAMLFLLYPPGASYQIGWSSPLGRTLGAHPLLLWRAMLWLSAEGYSELDLDLIDTVTAPGLARFKLGAGAEVKTLGSTRLWAPGTRLLSGLATRFVRPAA